MSADALLRPMRLADVPAAVESSYESLRAAGQVHGWHMPVLDDVLRARVRRRSEHLLRTDPDGAFVAEADGELVGVAMATVRGPLWFLSLLTVATAAQSRGLGRRLLGLAEQTRGGAAAICASNDPKALRRYRLAGLDLHPCLEGRGPLDRSLLPSVPDVREGSYDDDRELVEHVAVLQRGAPHGPDLDLLATVGRLLVTDSSAGRGYAVVGPGGPALLGATTPAVATALLWAALAEAVDEEVEVPWADARQQWALDVAVAARLPLLLGGARCTEGPVGLRTPYLPSGGLG